jgi:hypothetical protein
MRCLKSNMKHNILHSLIGDIGIGAIVTIMQPYFGILLMSLGAYRTFYIYRRDIVRKDFGGDWSLFFKSLFKK